MYNSWNSSLQTAAADGSALTNTTTPGSILPGHAKFTLPANFFQYAGQKLRLKASGRISTAASAPGTFTFDVRFGAIVVFNGGASPTLAVSASNLGWQLDVDLTCRSVGNSTLATILGQGSLYSAALSASTPIMLLPASAPAAGSGFDSTSSQVVDLFGTWSVANASNSITLHQYELISCN
jgi:hypothetical protein